MVRRTSRGLGRILWNDVGNGARMGDMRNTYKILVGKRDGKRPLGRPRRIWEDNIRMNLKETGCKGVD